MPYSRNQLVGYARRADFYRVEFSETRDIDCYLSMIEENQTDVLEIPCGAGRLTTHLAKKARHVTAVDIEPEMIASLRSHLAKHSIGERVTILHDDMRTVEFKNKFDLAYVPSEGLQLLEPSDAKIAIQNIRKSLKPNGQLIIDIGLFNCSCPNSPDYYNAKTQGSQWCLQWTQKLDNGQYLQRSVRHNRTNEFINFEFLYEIFDGDMRMKQFSEFMLLYLYDDRWFKENIPGLVKTTFLNANYGPADNPEIQSRLLITIK